MQAKAALDAAGLDVVEISPGVLRSSAGVAIVTEPVVAALKSYAQASARGRARILFHESESSLLQEMLIAAPGFTVWPPILNSNAPQSWTVMEGALAFVRYRPPGEIVDLRVVDAAAGKAACVRFAQDDWYTTVPLSPMTVYLEIKRGPYQATTLAQWGPQSADDPQAALLFDKLRALGFARPPAAPQGA